MPMVAQETLAQRVKRLRLAKGLTQQQLAVRGGLAISLVTQIEQGVTTNPRALTLRKLAAALEVSLDELAECLREEE